MTKPFPKFLALFLLLGFVIFLVSGGLFTLLGLGQGNGSSGLMNRPNGLEFVYPGDVNNLNAQQYAVDSLIVSLGIAALLAIVVLGIFRDSNRRPRKALGGIS